ncbi:hypothetical protein EVAR_49959_1 [Eumeta japonica]|uniref:Uncharacterized protein n=1 Tax=Eumeta variegata TaxID=151549 RepID=A0A4C1XWF9_EUMVA|nr:hypothetical protein EVAR_49959_1 [Eumeta japonica]
MKSGKAPRVSGRRPQHAPAPGRCTRFLVKAPRSTKEVDLQNSLNRLIYIGYTERVCSCSKNVPSRAPRDRCSSRN